MFLAASSSSPFLTDAITATDSCLVNSLKQIFNTNFGSTSKSSQFVSDGLLTLSETLVQEYTKLPSLEYRCYKIIQVPKSSVRSYYSDVFNYSIPKVYKNHGGQVKAVIRNSRVIE